MMNRRLLLAAGLAALATPALLPAPALAQLEALPRDQRLQVRDAASYLQNLKTAKGRFTQTSSRGASSSGTLYLNRPGKARFDYDPQYQMLVVADGHSVAVYDRRLKTFDKAPLGATPLGIFLARRIDLSTDVQVAAFTRTAAGFSIVLVDPQRNADGRLALEFQTMPMALLGWTVVDNQGVETRVRLTSLDETPGLDPDLFVIDDPRKPRR